VYLRFSGDFVDLTKGSFLDSFSPRLTKHGAFRLVPRESAGVAVIFHGSGDEEKVLLIKRAERKGDPWSGQVAFPGGMVSPSDRSFEETARRETAEEVGIDLASEAAVFLGYMREFKARTREIVVVPSVFKLAAAAAVTLNNEAASYEWVPLRSLVREDARSTYLLRRTGAELAFPSLVYRGLVIWGLTERIISAVLRASPDSGDDRVLGNVERY
jgi:8-oxo-dGTP pyrophosphatase MutT (NUDIX family)